MEYNFKKGGMPGTENKFKFKGNKSVAKIVIAVLLLLVIGFSCIKIVPEGFIGVKYQFGKIINTTLNPGLNLKVPFIQTVDLIDTREHIYETTTNAYTKDTQTVESLELTLNYSYVASELPNIIRTIGVQNIEGKVVVPAVGAILKNAIGKYKAEELVQNRSVLQEDVEEKLREELKGSGIYVNAFSIRNIDFEDSFEETIRAKVAAEQEALKKANETVTKEEEAKQLLIKAEAEAKAKKLEADAEAYSIKVIQEELRTSPQYTELQKIQKWNGILPQVTGNSVNPFVSIDGNASN